MAKEPKLYNEGYEEYPVITSIIGNAVILLWIALGTYLSAAVHYLVGVVYLVFALLMVGVVLRKLVCANCWYYGRRCATGWGKLSAMMFSRGDVSCFSTGAGVRMAPAVYGLLTLIPLVLGTVAVVSSDEDRVMRIGALVLLLVVSFISGAVPRRWSCERCKMRYLCPGSAAK